MLLTSKLFVPPLKRGHVPRTALVERLLGGLESRLTVIAAPAGYGKSAVLAELFSRLERPRALLSLEASDAEPARFWAHVAVALGRLTPGLGAAAAEALRSPRPPPFESLLDAWVEELLELHEPCLLAFDDLHLVDEPAIHRGLEVLVERLPPTLHLVLAGRQTPPLPLGRWRAGGDLVEVGEAELRFSLRESTAFLEAHLERRLQPGEVAALHQRTEGWPAGLQLAAVSLAPRAGKGTPDVGLKLGEIRGSHRPIAGYLTEEVFEVQPEARRSQLLALSVLESFDSPLCAAVTGLGARPAQELLEALERENLPLVRLDEDGGWYRFHHLFGEYLGHRCRRQDPEGWREAHRRAAARLADDGLAEQAFGHAVEAGDRAWAADLLGRAAGALSERGELLTLLRAFQRLGVPIAELGSELLMALTWAFFLGGRQAELTAALAVLEARRAAGELEPLVLAQLLNLRAGLERQRGDLPASIASLEEALEVAPPEHLPLRAGIALYLAVAHYFTGSLEAAAEAARTCVGCFSRDEPLSLVGVTGLSLLANVRCLQGRLAEAESFCREALVWVCAGAPAAREPFQLALVHRTVARIELERGHWAAAGESCERALALADRAGFSELSGQILLWQGEVARLTGDAALSERVLARLATLEARDGLVAGSAEWRAALRLHLALDAGDATAADREMKAARAFLEAPPSLQNESLRIAACRWAASHGRREEAWQRLRALQEPASAEGRLEKELELAVWEVSLLIGESKTGAAGALAARTLEAARPEGHLRPFAVARKPVRALLAELLRQGGELPAPARPFAVRVERTLAELDRLARQLASARERSASPGLLSEREAEVLGLLAEGLSNQQVAERLFVALSTVKTHVNRIFHKLGVRRRTQAIARARALGLLGPPERNQPFGG